MLLDTQILQRKYQSERATSLEVYVKPGMRIEEDPGTN